MSSLQTPETQWRDRKSLMDVQLIQSFLLSSSDGAVASVRALQRLLCLLLGCVRRGHHYSLQRVLLPGAVRVRLHLPGHPKDCL